MLWELLQPNSRRMEALKRWDNLLMVVVDKLHKEIDKRVLLFIFLILVKCTIFSSRRKKKMIPQNDGLALGLKGF